MAHQNLAEDSASLSSTCSWRENQRQHEASFALPIIGVYPNRTRQAYSKNQRQHEASFGLPIIGVHPNR